MNSFRLFSYVQNSIFMDYTKLAKIEYKDCAVHVRHKRKNRSNNRLMVCNKVIKQEPLNVSKNEKMVHKARKERNRKNKWGESSKDWRPSNIESKYYREGCFYSCKPIKPNKATRKNFRRMEAAEYKLKEWNEYGYDEAYIHSYDDSCSYEDSYLYAEQYDEDYYEDDCDYDCYYDDYYYDDYYYEDDYYEEREPTVEELWSAHEYDIAYELECNDEELADIGSNDTLSFEDFCVHNSKTLTIERCSKNRATIRKITND